MYYEDTYRVGARDTDPFNQCRPSSLLNFLQEAATQAAVELRLSRAEVAGKYGGFWMLARLWYRLDRPLYWDDRLTVRTFHRGGKGVSLYRDFDLYQDGRPIGEAVSTWVLADLETRRLARLSEVEELAGTTGGELCKSVRLHRLPLPERMEAAERRLLHYSDTDINGHVNNVRYADFACDAIHLEREGAGKFVSSFRISYLKECRPGETITLSAGREGGVWHAFGADRLGVRRFEAAMTLEKVPEILDTPRNPA